MTHARSRILTYQWSGKLFATLALLLAPAMLRAQAFENLDRLDSLVAMTVGANLGEPGGPVAPIDRRLRLKPCPSTPRIDGPTFGAAVVSCAETGWRLRVPLVAAVAPAPQHGASTRAEVSAASDTGVVVIKKGDPVELIADGEAFSVSRAMIAEEDGAVGRTIRVRQDAKSPPISARVERAGLVRAPTI